MFHKEDTALFGCVAKNRLINDTSSNNNHNNNASSRKGGKHNTNVTNNPKKNKAATMDVPLKKSVRKQLYQRACSYFSPSLVVEDNDNNNKALDELLKQVFLQGNLSSRSLPLAEKQQSMVLYVKTGTGSSEDNDTNNNSNNNNSFKYPYTNSTQFVWMAMVDGKTKIVDESPTVALWGILSTCLGLSSSSSSSSLSSSLSTGAAYNSDWHQWYTVQVPPAVSKYICRGADLMKAGMRSIPTERPDYCLKEQTNNHSSQTTVAIMVQGNPQPFAVGRLLLSSSSSSSSTEEFGYQTKGIGVEIWSAYGDDLWRQSAAPSNCTNSNKGVINLLGGGDPFENGNFGNVGFSKGSFVYPLTTSEGDSSNEEEEEEKGAEKGAAAGQEKMSGEDDEAAQSQSAQEGNDEGSDQVEDEATPEDHLHQAVCQALVNLSNKDFPMLITTFYSKHVVPNSNQKKLDLKQTKYKKFGAYIKEQVALGLLLVGPDKVNKKNKDPMAMILGYYKKHEDVQGLTKSAPVDTSGSTSTKLVLVNLYVIQSSIVSLMRLDADEVAATNATSEERRGTGMLTSPEVKKIIENYIEREELVHDKVRKDQVQLDGPLTDAIFPPKQQKQNPQPLPTALKRKDVYQQFMARLQPAYALVAMPGSKITILKRGSPPKVEIEVSMRQSRKFVTRIRGMEEYGIDGQVLSKDVSKRLACSSTVDTEASNGRAALKKGRVEVEFQGNICVELEALLTGDESLSAHGGVKNSDYAIPLKVLEVILRKGVPARKRKGGGKKKK